MSEFIVVGLGYAKGDTPTYSRRRDYTPTRRGDADAQSDIPGRPVVFGEAEAYRQFVRDEVFPFIAGHYRADMNRKLIVGQSYGALFAVHALLTEPTMFQAYLIGSPSLWFDHHVMMQRERDYAASHRDLKAQVFLGVGAFEHPKPGSRNPRYDPGADMVGDMQAFAAALRSRHYPGLQLQSHVYEGEDHLTLPPLFFTRALMGALGTPEAQTP
jgi:predicted alpha/beta superfamily hydrolase